MTLKLFVALFGWSLVFIHMPLALSADETQENQQQEANIFASSSGPSSEPVAEQKELFELSISSAVLFALHNNPDIEIFWSRFKQSEFFVEEGMARFYPQVDLSISAGRQYNDPSAGTDPPKADLSYTANASLTIEQMLFDGFEALEEVRRREKLSESAFWRVQSNVQAIVTSTVDAYLDILRYQQEVGITAALIRDIDSTLGYITQQFEAGAVEKFVLDYAFSRRAFAETQIRTAQSSLNDAISQLEFLTGKLPPDFITYYPEDLYPDKLDLQYYLDYMEENNSTLIANRYEIEAMQHRLEVEKAALYPDVNFRFEAREDHNNGGEVGRERDVTATINLTYNIFDGFEKRNARKRVKSQIDELAIQKQQLEKELRRDIKLAYNQVIANFKSISTTNGEIVASRNLKALNEESFRLGRINIIELIESAERLTQAQLRRVSLERDLYYNAYQLLLLSNVIDQQFFCETC